MRAIVFSSGASTTLMKSMCPSVAHCAFTLAPSCSISLLTSRMGCGLFLIVCTPSGVRVESMIQVGMFPLLAVALRQRCIRSFTSNAVFGEQMNRLTAILAASACALAIVPASAAAATWAAPLARCYVSGGPDVQNRQIVTVGATGFTPLSSVDVLLDGAPADA